MKNAKNNEYMCAFYCLRHGGTLTWCEKLSFCGTFGNFNFKISTRHSEHGGVFFNFFFIVLKNLKRAFLQP